MLQNVATSFVHLDMPLNLHIFLNLTIISVSEFFILVGSESYMLSFLMYFLKAQHKRYCILNIWRLWVKDQRHMYTVDFFCSLVTGSFGLLKVFSNNCVCCVLQRCQTAVVVYCFRYVFAVWDYYFTSWEDLQ